MRRDEWSINTSGQKEIHKSILSFRFWLYKSTYNGRTRGHVSSLLFTFSKQKQIFEVETAIKVYEIAAFINCNIM